MRFVAMLVTTLVLARPAGACGVPNFGEAIAEALKTESEPTQLPLVAVGVGDGEWSAAIGYGWGRYDSDWLFSGSSITRVMFDVRTSHTDTALALTYGWYQNKLLSTGFDIGAEAITDGEVGPTARLTLGVHGIGLQLRGAALLRPELRAEGSAELVVEVMELTGRLK